MVNIEINYSIFFLFYYLGQPTEGSYLVLFCNFFFKVYLHGFAQAAAETAGKKSVLVDENANKIEEKKSQ